LTIEDDAITIWQGLILFAGPIFLHRTVLLWQGIIAGGTAKSQAWITFSSDPLTILSFIVCAGTLISFWIFALVFRNRNQS